MEPAAPSTRHGPRLVSAVNREASDVTYTYASTLRGRTSHGVHVYSAHGHCTNRDIRALQSAGTLDRPILGQLVRGSRRGKP